MMSAGVLWLVVGWVPLWLLALKLGAPARPGRWLMGGCLAAFIAGVATAEMRRHGLLSHHPNEPYLPLLGLHVHEIVRFFLIGATGALAGEWVQDIWSRRSRRAGAEGADSATAGQ